MKKYLIIVLNLIIIASCTNNSVIRDIKNNLNKTVNLENFDTVRYGNDLMPFNKFRQKYKYVSIIYLEDGCQPCYPKFIKWQNKIDSLNVRDDYTILFIIKGANYYDFIAKVHEIGTIEDHYYTIMDDELKYLINNNDIPRWIIDGSVLIGPDNKIKMIGEPWSTKEMTDMFYSICK